MARKPGRKRESAAALEARGTAKDAKDARRRRKGAVEQPSVPRRRKVRIRELKRDEILSGIPGYDPRLHAGDRYVYDHKRALRAIRFFHGHLTLAEGAEPGTPFVLQPWQQAVVGNLFGWVDRKTRRRRYWYVFVYVPKKNGKALALDTPIPTPGGWTTMGEVREGDLVFDETGTIRTVVGVSEIMHGHRCFRVRFSDGESVVADADHVWRTAALSEDYREANRTTAEIAATVAMRADGAREHSIRVAGGLQLGDTDLPVPPYTLGAWLGDGNSRCARITGTDADSGIAEGIRADGFMLSRPSYDARSPGTYSAGIVTGRRSTNLQSRLRRLGVLGNKHIPESYLRAGLTQRWALLRGLMDTDGSVRQDCEYGSANERLAADVSALLRTLGFKPTIVVGRARCNGKDCGPVHRVRFRAYADQPVFGLGRKQARLPSRPRRAARSLSRQIVAVEPVPSVPVRCIAVDSPSRLYLAGRHMVPTHNTELSAGIMVYVLATEARTGIRCISLAASRDQTDNVFNPAATMIAQDDDLRRMFTVFGASEGAQKKSIVANENRLSTFRGLPHDADTSDGKNPHMVIGDELHRWKKADLLGIMLKGMVSRALHGEPFAFLTTTAGTSGESLCNDWLKRARATRDNRGRMDDAGYEPRLLPVIFEASPKDDWRSPETHRRANPSYGVTVSPEALEEEVRAIRNQPSLLNDFLRFHLNIVTDQKEAAIPMQEWDACPSVPPSEMELAREWANGGLDLSHTIDLTSLALWWPKLSFMRWWFWIPRDRALVAEDRDAVPYTTWARMGYVELVEGNTIDPKWIEDRVLAICSGYKVRDVGYDPWGPGRAVALACQGKGLPMVEMRQGHVTLGAPSKALEAAITSHRFNHGGNPAARWNAGNLAWRRDANGNIAPEKGDRPNLRIDGMVAGIMAIGRATAQPAPKRSSYEGRRMVV